MRQLKISHAITLRSTNAVDKYLVDISRIGLISHEQEIDFAIKIRDGFLAKAELQKAQSDISSDRENSLTDKIKEGEKAACKLVNANLRFVVSVAKQYQNRGVDLLDLINEGNLGLARAAERFDHTRGFKFISYAVWWVRQCILQAIAEHGRQIRVPLNKVAMHNKFLNTYSKIEQETGRTPLNDEVYDIMDVSKRDAIDIHFMLSRVVSYDARINNDEDAPVLLDSLKYANDFNDEDDFIDINSRTIDINRTLQTLSENEKFIIENFYGLNGEKSISLPEIAEKMNLTQERVRQIKEKAIRRMRILGRGKLLKKYL